MTSLHIESLVFIHALLYSTSIRIVNTAILVDWLIYVKVNYHEYHELPWVPLPWMQDLSMIRAKKRQLMTKNRFLEF